MFFHQYKYRLKYFFKTPTVLFWALIFPILLGSFFQATFGTAQTRAESFKAIPVAVVLEDDNEVNQQFLTMMSNISYSDSSNMFKVTQSTKEEAVSLLDDEEINGIITLTDTRELTVKDSGMSESIIHQFLNEYLRTESYITDIAKNHPEELTQAIANISSSMDLVKPTSLNGGGIDATSQYFYALIAMTCLFGSYLGLTNAKDLQANLSAIATRRCVSASKKITMLVADSLAALTVHFGELVIVYFFLRYVLGRDIGEQPIYFFLTCFIGSLIGIFLGQFIGIVVKGSAAAKEGIATTVSLVMSFLSGLMFSNMKDIVEKNAPFINRINPAALITDCFYSLTVFNDMTRFYQSLITLVIISFILLTFSIILVRREKYESI